MNKILTFFLFIILSFNLSANGDFGQFLSEQPGLGDLDDKKISTDSEYLPIGYNEEHKEEANIQKQTKGNYVPLPGELEDREQFLEYDYKEVLKNNDRNSVRAVTFLYLYDTYDYKNNRDSYDKTYRNSTEAFRSGSFHFLFDKYLSKGKTIFLGVGAGVGFGYHRGNGNFRVDGVEADMKFYLWTLPLDFGGIASVRMGSWGEFFVSGGPSIMGLIQGRDDKEAKDRKKKKRQVGTGYYGRVAFKVNFTKLFPTLAYKLLSQSDVSRATINLEVRHHNYARFQDDDITISGTSFGLGFTYNYL
jgi:hypothetical protein